MRSLATIGLVSAIVLAASVPAQARQGCGRGFHQNHWGRCVPNRAGARQIVWVEGRFYPGHGYWYQNRWWQHRYRQNHVWRYR